MNRLRDESVADPSLARGIDVVRSTPASPPMAEAKRRVWAALELGGAGARVREARRLSPFRILALTAVILCVGGTAGAVIGRRWIGPLLVRLAGPDRSLPAAAGDGGSSRAPRLWRAHPVAPAFTPPVVDTKAPPAVAVPGPDRRPARGPAVRDAAAPRPRAADRHDAWRELGSAERSPSRGGVGTLPGSPGLADGQVLDAMVALRRDHDAARAGDLLARYLAEHPRGALREEALVLSIEAADARGDKAAAEKMASEYHARYPAGRFQRFVSGYADRVDAAGLRPAKSVAGGAGDPPRLPASDIHLGEPK